MRRAFHFCGTVTLIALLPQLAPASTLYGLSTQSSQLCTINQTNAIGSFIFGGGPNTLTGNSIDLASDFRAASPRLWATDTQVEDSLMLVNPSTGKGSLVATYGMGVTGPSMRAIAFDVTSAKLYGIVSANSDGTGVQSLYEINPATAAITLIGDTGFQLIRGLGADLSGTLFAVSSDGLDSQLLRIDKSTGAAALVGSLGIPVATDLAVRPEDGVMFMSAGSIASLTSIYTIDTSTAATTFIGQGNVVGIGGIAFLPEPSMLAAAPAVAAWATARRRRHRGL